MIDENPIFRVLAPDCVKHSVLPFEQRIELAGSSGISGLALVAFAVPAKVPLYQETAGEAPPIGEEGDAAGLEIIDVATGRSFFFIPGCAAMTELLRRRLAASALVFFDGTVWQDDEMINAGLGHKTGKSMGHVAMSGEHGAIARLADLTIDRKIFLHINNSNPALLQASPERQIAESAGWQIPADGTEIVL